MSSSLPCFSARRFARSSALRASDIFVAATPARGEASTCGTTARAVSRSLFDFGVEAQAATPAAATVARIKLYLCFMALLPLLIVRRTLRVRRRRRPLGFLAQRLDARQQLVCSLACSSALRLRDGELGIELRELCTPLCH